jgi:hypothetical protein
MIPPFVDPVVGAENREISEEREPIVVESGERLVHTTNI